MMSTLHLLSYNNYYNRIVKMEASLSAYQGYQVKYNGQATDPNGNTAIIEGVNFVDGDFVDTTQVVNWQGDLPNYVLVVDDGIIKSRWFVVGANKTRGGQLLLDLHRDLVVDYYTNLMSDQTSIFVEKATIPSFNDLIFNSEDMSFNQIKTSELLLKDNTQCPWIVLYGARNNGEGQGTTFTSTFKTDYPFIEITDQQYNQLLQWATTDNSIKFIFRGDPVLDTKITMLAGNAFSKSEIDFSTKTAPVQKQVSFVGSVNGAKTFQPDALSRLEPIYRDILTQAGNVAYAYNDRVNPTLYDAILANQNVILKYTAPGASSAKYYQLTVYDNRSGGFGVSNYAGSLIQILAPLKELYTEPNQVTFGSLTENKNISILFSTPAIAYYLKEIPEPTTQGNGDKVTIGANRYHLIDAPYDMFCLPLSDALFIANSKVHGFVRIKSNQFLNLSVANQLIADYGGIGQIYDAQILPYCPLSGYLMTTDESGNLVYDINDASQKGYSYIEGDGGARKGYVLHASRSAFAVSIDLEDPIVITDYKIESECDLYRLNSPNYAAVFEFNAAKNGGITTFNIKCTYKPFSPYIKVYPNFGRLYGNDYNDARGLVCSGDFSLPMLTDQWKTYELSNKNYQASFDRQIQNLEINNSVQREREIWSLASSSLSAGITGATGGALSAGGPAGAVVGGVLGAGLSIAGGVRDLQLNDKLRNEAIDYAQDQFGYQLGNIKALPQTLSRTSAYNIDNKYFPFLEYFTCSEVEKQALRDKIKFNGMTVMAIGTMKYYKENYRGTDPMYFKGKLIRLEGFTGDYHILNAIANEIYKGVFI